MEAEGEESGDSSSPQEVRFTGLHNVPGLHKINLGAYFAASDIYSGCYDIYVLCSLAGGKEKVST